MTRELRVGDRVQCVDGSYAFGIKNGLWNEYALTNQNNDRDNLKVLTMGLRVRRNHPGLSDDIGYCDMLVTDSYGNYWFTRSDLCKLIPQMHTITIDGKTIEISDESYENFKRQLTD